jgi:hypothetical protein
MENKLRRIEIRRGLSSQRTSVLYEEGEPVYIIDKKRVYIGDNTTLGGILASNVNFIEESKKIPNRAVSTDIFYDKQTQTTFIIDENNQIVTLLDSPYCCEQIQKKIDDYNAYLNYIYLKYCACEGLITDNNELLLDDSANCILLDDKKEEECIAPYISNKTMNFNSNKTYTLNIFNPLNDPQNIVFDKNLPDSDLNNPKRDLIITGDIKVTGNGLSVSSYTDRTITLKTDDITIIEPEPITLSYTLDNGCTTSTKTISGFIDSENDRRFYADFDYMVVTYLFTDGKDLDTRAYISYTTIDNQVVEIQDFVGVGSGGKNEIFIPNVKYKPPMISFAGDNTGVGSEYYLIDVSSLKKNAPNIKSISVEFKCYWYVTNGKNPVKISAELYKHNDLKYTKSNKKFIITPTYSKIPFNVESYSKVITQRVPNPQSLAKLDYNIISKYGVFKST